MEFKFDEIRSLWCELISFLSQIKSSLQELVLWSHSDPQNILLCITKPLNCLSKAGESVDLQYIRSGLNSSVKNGASAVNFKYILVYFASLKTKTDLIRFLLVYVVMYLRAWGMQWRRWIKWELKLISLFSTTCSSTSCYFLQYCHLAYFSLKEITCFSYIQRYILWGPWQKIGCHE